MSFTSKSEGQERVRDPLVALEDEIKEMKDKIKKIEAKIEVFEAKKRLSGLEAEVRAQAASASIPAQKRQ
jgi:predicted  nucleic acid-binding Zn-ribbon protein